MIDQFVYIFVKMYTKHPPKYTSMLRNIQTGLLITLTDDLEIPCPYNIMSGKPPSLPFARLHVLRQLLDAQVLQAQLIQRAALTPVIRVVDDARQADDRVYPAHGNPIPLPQRRNWHQAHWNLLKQVAVVQRGRRLDPIIAGLVVNGFVQGFAARVVCQRQPFQPGARPNPQRRSDRAAFPVHRFQQFGDGRGNPVNVKLKIAVGGFNPAGIEQGDGWVEDGAHVVQPGLQHVSAVNILWENAVDGVQHGAVLGGGQGCQRNGLFNPEDARVAGPLRTAGVDKGLRLGDDGLARAVVLPQHLHEFNRSAGAPRVQ